MDALHGDIGVVTREDVAIAVSNSGESDELATVLADLQHRGVPVVAIVGDLELSIARSADVALDAAPMRRRAPVAPTASTTVAIALGDAIAAILMTAKNFTAEDFALNHPAGALGKRLDAPASAT